ncbi:YoaK family protein [Roseibium sp. RKSG952]|uniref:YoaK family protein n=1 Tax=Roseibium sp. RKSG952 TaxID=2529384 RepID=UPI0012BC8D30|nr:YoaK family protein [Roseibium sp. RKSG952]MTH98233.1 DUF1275 domain-containing protein [Roseibium sp. RKSG952]
MNAPLHSRLNIEFLLAFVAGFVEAVCVTGLFSTFVTFITGTMVFMVVEFAEGTPGFYLKVFVLLTFLGFSLLWIHLIRRLNEKIPNTAFVMLLVECLLLFLMFVAGLVMGKQAIAFAPGTFVLSFLAVGAMSLHSTIFFRLLNKKAPTHFMTGNTTNMIHAALEMVDAWSGKEGSPAPANPDAAAKARYYLVVILSFLAGVIFGTYGYLLAGFASLGVPVAVLAFSAFVNYRSG